MYNDTQRLMDFSDNKTLFCIYQYLNVAKLTTNHQTSSLLYLSTYFILGSCKAHSLGNSFMHIKNNNGPRK